MDVQASRATLYTCPTHHIPRGFAYQAQRKRTKEGTGSDKGTRTPHEPRNQAKASVDWEAGGLAYQYVFRDQAHNQHT